MSSEYNKLTGWRKWFTEHPCNYDYTWVYLHKSEDRYNTAKKRLRAIIANTAETVQLTDKEWEEMNVGEYD